MSSRENGHVKQSYTCTCKSNWPPWADFIKHLCLIFLRRQIENLFLHTNFAKFGKCCTFSVAIHSRIVELFSLWNWMAFYINEIDPIHVCSGNISLSILPNIFTKMPAKDNRSSFQEYLQATFLEHKNNCTSQWACLNRQRL